MRTRSFQDPMYTPEEALEEQVVPATHTSPSTIPVETSGNEADSAPRAVGGLVFGSLLGALLWLGLILTGAALIR